MRLNCSYDLQYEPCSTCVTQGTVAPVTMFALAFTISVLVLLRMLSGCETLVTTERIKIPCACRATTSAELTTLSCIFSRLCMGHFRAGGSAKVLRVLSSSFKRQNNNRNIDGETVLCVIVMFRRGSNAGMLLPFILSTHVLLK